MATDVRNPERYVEAVRQSGLSIYDPIEMGDPELWIPTPDLEQLLNAAMTGISLAGLPLRTRSKVVKEHVCRALGYPIPSSFKRTRPRFPGQLFDTYVAEVEQSGPGLERRYCPHKALRDLSARCGRQDRQSESSSGQPFGVAGHNGHADTEVSSEADSRHFTRGIDCARGYRVASAIRARWSRPRNHCKPGPSSSGRTAIPNWRDLQPVTGPRWTRLHGHRLRPGTQPGRDVAPSGVSTLGICRLSRRWAISRRASSTPRSEVANFPDD